MKPIQRRRHLLKWQNGVYTELRCYCKWMYCKCVTFQGHFILPSRFEVWNSRFSKPFQINFFKRSNNKYFSWIVAVLFVSQKWMFFTWSPRTDFWGVVCFIWVRGWEDVHEIPFIEEQRRKGPHPKKVAKPTDPRPQALIYLLYLLYIFAFPPCHSAHWPENRSAPSTFPFFVFSLFIIIKWHNSLHFNGFFSFSSTMKQNKLISLFVSVCKI